MALNNKGAMYDNPIEVVKPFASYLAMFVGMGLISGSVVHAGQAAMFKQASILIVIGMVLFAVGSYINEVVFKTGDIERSGVPRYIFLSLFLAMGVGMISGSTQHFLDTPIYASYLMPMGIFVASLAFAFRNNYVLSRATWIKLLVVGVIFAAVLFYGLNSFAKSLAPSTGHHGEASSETITHDDTAVGTHTEGEAHLDGDTHSEAEVVTEEPAAHVEGDGHAH